MNTDVPYVEPQCPIARIKDALLEIEASWKEAQEAANHAEIKASAMQSILKEIQGEKDRLRMFLQLETSRREKLGAPVWEMQEVIKSAAKEVKK